MQTLVFYFNWRQTIFSTRFTSVYTSLDRYHLCVLLCRGAHRRTHETHVRPLHFPPSVNSFVATCHVFWQLFRRQRPVTCGRFCLACIDAVLNQTWNVQAVFFKLTAHDSFPLWRSNKSNIFLQLATQVEKRCCTYYRPPQTLSGNKMLQVEKFVKEKSKRQLNLLQHAAWTCNNRILLRDNVWGGW